MKNFNVAIIGGGASGMACAITLKKLNPNLSTVIIERNDRLGKKLSATGNGQGNLTNLNMSTDKYFCPNPQILSDTLGDYDSALHLFSCLFSYDGSGKVYPSGKQASALTDDLIYSLKKLGVQTLLSTSVVKIDKGFVLTLSNGEKIGAQTVVLCAGGKAQKQFGTDGTAYSLAQKFGHKITALYPSLVQIKTDVSDVKTLRGIRADCVATAVVDGKKVKSFRGDVIFTEYGVSGNAIFSLSPYLVDKENVQIALEFLPDLTESEIIDSIQNKKLLGYDTSELLSGSVHNQIGRAIIKRSKSDDAKIIARTLKNFNLEVRGNLGFDYAQVTRGGIDTEQIDCNLQSKLCKNLYFAGEILDVDGECGGYNLHWAFKSGIKVATAIATDFNNND